MKLHYLIIVTLVFPLAAMDTTDANTLPIVLAQQPQHNVDIAIELPEMNRSVSDCLTEFARACANNNEKPVQQLLEQPTYGKIIRECTYNDYNAFRNHIGDMNIMRYYKNTALSSCIVSLAGATSLLATFWFKCYGLADQPPVCDALAPSELGLTIFSYFSAIGYLEIRNRAFRSKRALLNTLDALRNPQISKPNEHDLVTDQSRLLTLEEEA